MKNVRALKGIVNILVMLSHAYNTKYDLYGAF